MATVLMVDDQEEILTLARSFLEEQGHKTLSAATADGALAILTGSEAVDALFVDIILNGDMQAGIELAKRAVEMKPRLKVVYSTGLSVTDGMKALFVPGSDVLRGSVSRRRPISGRQSISRIPEAVSPHGQTPAAIWTETVAGRAQAWRNRGRDLAGALSHAVLGPVSPDDARPT